MGRKRYIKNPPHVNIHFDVVQHDFRPQTHGTVFHFAIAKNLMFSRRKKAMHGLKSLALSFRAVL